jgi:hypothetical protein
VGFPSLARAAWFEDAYVAEPPSTSREAQGMHMHMHMQDAAEAERTVMVGGR